MRIHRQTDSAYQALCPLGCSMPGERAAEEGKAGAGGEGGGVARQGKCKYRMKTMPVELHLPGIRTLWCLLNCRCLIHVLFLIFFAFHKKTPASLASARMCSLMQWNVLSDTPVHLDWYL
jgi:hypothetical protein